MLLLTLSEIYQQMATVAHEDQSPVFVDRLQFLNWVVSLDTMRTDPSTLPPAPSAEEYPS